MVRIRLSRHPSARLLGAFLLLGTALPTRLTSLTETPRRAGGLLAQEVQRRGEANVVVTLRPSRIGRRLPPRARVDEVLRGTIPREVELGHRLESVPVFIARVTEKGLVNLLGDPRVSRVDLDGEIRGADIVSAAQIGADRVQELSFSGEGVTVAMLDSGTDILENPDLESALAGEECFCSRNGGCCPDGSARQSGAGSARTVTSHGPGVMGIIASRGIVSPLGIAPGARVLMVRVLDDALVGTFSDILLALDWVVTHAPEVRLVNLSIAAGPYPSPCDHADSFNEAVAQLSAAFRERGGLFVAASGNYGTATLFGSPACVGSVLSVGAVDESDRVPSYSSGGESLDLLAPGDRILSASSFGRVQVLRGTSAAAPHVAASAALLLSANPALSAADLEERLKSRGVVVTDPRTNFTIPRVDVFRALLLPMEVALAPPVLSLKSRGRGFTLMLTPRSPFAAADLDSATLQVFVGNGPGVPVDPSSAELEDTDGDGLEDLVVHVNRRLLLSGISGYGDVPLTVAGAYRSGVEVRGTTTLRILPPTGSGAAHEPTP